MKQILTRDFIRTATRSLSKYCNFDTTDYKNDYRVEDNIIDLQNHIKNKGLSIYKVDSEKKTQMMKLHLASLEIMRSQWSNVKPLTSEEINSRLEENMLNLLRKVM